MCKKKLPGYTSTDKRFKNTQKSMFTSLVELTEHAAKASPREPTPPIEFLKVRLRELEVAPLELRGDDWTPVCRRRPACQKGRAARRKETFSKDPCLATQALRPRLGQYCFRPYVGLFGEPLLMSGVYLPTYTHVDKNLLLQSILIKIILEPL